MPPRNDPRLPLSRRRVLAGLGAVGLASAGAGLGTSAFFSDAETFRNNSIVAGSLDLKVDWEEHYYDGSAGEAEPTSDLTAADYLLPAFEPATAAFDVTEGRLGPLRVSSPDDARPIALNFTGDGTLQERKDRFWDATAIEAYPDVDDDGIQDAFDTEHPVNGGTFTVGPVCEVGADTPEDLDPTAGLRTENEDTMGKEWYKPLVSLEDVKPGDFGELTLSYHLCDNPGYVWLTGELLENAENGLTEPEAMDPDEDDGVGVEDPEAGDQWSGELADHILTRIWYDEDCDNQVSEESGELDMVVAIDTSGSIRGDEQDQMRDGVNAFIDALPADGSIRVGTITFGDNSVSQLQGLDTPDNISVSLPSFSGNTPLPAAIDIADQLVRNDPSARMGAQKTVVLFTDGGPNYENETYAANGYEAPRTDTADWSATPGDSTYDNADTGAGTVTEAEMDETAIVADSVRAQTTRIATVFIGDDDSTDAMTADAIATYDTLPAYLADEIASPGFSFTVDFVDLDALAAQLVDSIVVGEEVFFVGTLAQALAYLSDGNGIPLDGDLSTAYDELADPHADDDRECFPAQSTHCVGFEWWLPVNHSNQIQTDSVAFDLGFYTEQCRHNDGAGQASEVDA